MWKILIVTACILMAALDTEAAKRTKKRGAGSYAGGYSGAGSYGDFDDLAFAPYAPYFGFGFIDPYAFHQQLTQQILSQQAAQQNAIAQSFQYGDASVTAAASNLPYDTDDDLINRQQQSLFNNARNQNQFSYGGNKGSRYAPNYSVAAASLGPNGGYQTGFISPENPSVPNFSSRFGSSSPGGFKGVSVSSYSSSDGSRGAQTTVNDNGRISTHKTHS